MGMVGRWIEIGKLGGDSWGMRKYLDGRDLLYLKLAFETDDQECRMEKMGVQISN